jgi:O-methyltransferase involved in polyketide biosynthesis
MPELAGHDLSGVEQSLLLPLYIRAVESQRPDPLLTDEQAVAFVTRRGDAFTGISKIHMDEEDQVAVLLRNREFDRATREFLARHPEAVVVHIGCGLDMRFERVDNGRVEWYDLDLPQVIALRRAVIAGEAPRYHLLACSVFDPAWMETVAVHGPRPLLCLAEGVVMYCAEADVRALVLALRDRFPGTELLFDAFSPYLVRANNLRFRLSRSGLHVRYRWGLRRGEDVERWGEGIQLVGTWFPLDHPEPRLARVRWMRHLPLFARVLGIYHYRLGASGV